MAERLRDDGRLNEMMSAWSRSRLSCCVKQVTETFAGATTRYSGPRLHDVFADTPML
jgi:hypothetical protein